MDDLQIQVRRATMWPTPADCVPNDGENLGTWLERRERVKKTAKNGNGMGTPLSIAVQLWPTPNASKAGNDVTLRASGDGRQTPNKLGWAVAEQENSKNVLSTSEKQSDSPNGESTQPRYLNPEWVEWLMGFPIGWTDLEGSETPSSLKSPNSGGE